MMITSEESKVYTSSSVEQTQSLGEQLGQALKPGDVLAFNGELGSGKTTFIQGIAKGLGFNPDRIKSPTFVLMREYPGKIPLIHIDGYRLEGPPMVAWLDVETIFSPFKVTLIEWADRFESLLPENTIYLQLDHLSTQKRCITINSSHERARELISNLPEALPELARPKKVKPKTPVQPDQEVEPPSNESQPNESEQSE